MITNNMTDQELYEKAKQEYYNGTPILSDYEFDELEKNLGLENNTYIGAKHNSTYTVKHPFIMGSLSKVQIKEAKDGSIDWQGYLDQVKSYVGNKPLIITPKFDGCSFEIVWENGTIQSVSSRGDGEYGKDLSKALEFQMDFLIKPLSAFGKRTLALRGEVLIKKDIFKEKYSDFVNPRSFVSGILNRDYDGTDKELLDAYKDLSIVIYDIREKINGKWQDSGWYDFKDKIPFTPYFYKNGYNCLTINELASVYQEFEDYRNTKSPFALDGIVLKPVDNERENNTTLERPKDCVAIKFVPMLQETVVQDIEWNLGKTGEMFPTVIVKPVIMDGKVVSRVSGNNFGYILEHRIGIGTRITLSLAGDIIPFIYKVIDSSAFNVLDYQGFANEALFRIDGCHLYKALSKDERDEQMFLESAHSLGIEGIGDSAAKTIYDYLKEQAQGDAFLSIEPSEVPTNILCTTGAEIRNALGGKLGINAEKAYNKYKSTITLAEVIVSCNFLKCGTKVAQEVANEMLFGNGNFAHLPEKGYSWCLDSESKERKYLDSVLMKCGKTLEMFRNEQEILSKHEEGRIPIIMTGEPNNYTSKSDFLAKHTEYKETGSWKEAQIVFTSSLESTTSKMKKAKDKGIRIELY